MREYEKGEREDQGTYTTIDIIGQTCLQAYSISCQVIQSDIDSMLNSFQGIDLRLLVDVIKAAITRKHDSYSRRGETRKKNQLKEAAIIARELQAVCAERAVVVLLKHACNAGHGLAAVHRIYTHRGKSQRIPIKLHKSVMNFHLYVLRHVWYC